MKLNKNDKTRQRYKNLLYGFSFLGIVVILYLITIAPILMIIGFIKDELASNKVS